MTEFIGTLVAIVIGSWLYALAKTARGSEQLRQQRLRDHLHRVDIIVDPQPLLERREAAWRQFVEGHHWPASCPDCVWWVPAPAEAEDAIAVYRPCAKHDPAYGADQERRWDR